MGSDITLEFLAKQKNLAVPLLNVSLQRAAQNGLILMQSTGLTDKNGKEIFEGDIVKGRTYRYGYELDTGEQFDYLGYVGWLGTEFCRYVVHDADTYQMTFTENSGITMGSSWDLSQLVHRNTVDYLTGEVIGNIWENPELLPKE